MEINEFNLWKKSKRLVIFGFIIFLIVLFSSLIFASFQTGTPSHFIDKIYGPSFNISGWVNISFDEESTNSTFFSFFDSSQVGSVNLKDVLDKNPAYTYSCTPLDCEKSYNAINGESSKSFTLSPGGSKIFGLRISSSQPIQSISSFSMGISSNAGVYSAPQLIIDILNDNETDWMANKPDENYREKNYGCFEVNKTEGNAELTTSQYCQRISLHVFPQVKIGSNLQALSGGNVNFTLSISNETSGIYKSCTQQASGSGEISCVIPDLKNNEARDFFVCIRAKNIADNNKYGVKNELDNPCGFTEFFQGDYTYDFEIFAQPSLYGPVGNFVLNNTEMQNSGGSGMIESKILNYISEKYGGDCSSGCIIPIVFKSNTNQAISISNIRLSYVAGISSTTTTLYDLTEDFAKISSNYQRLFINNIGFSVPSEIETYDFSLKLNSQELFSENIEVKDVPIIKSLTPRSTAMGFPEKFVVDVTSPTDVNISGYKWDFGDNSTLTTPVNTAVHIYSAIGTYNLKITVMDSRGFNSSKIFEINVSSAKNLIQSTLNKMNTNLLNLKVEIQNQGLFQQKSLNSVLKIVNMSSQLEELEQKYNQVVNESEYLNILDDLLEIQLPEKIFKTKQANSFLFFPNKNNIDMNIVQFIGGGEYESNKIENYKQAIMAWQLENVELELDFNEFSGEYDSNIIPLVNIFEIKIDEKKDIIDDYYLIIPQLENIGFETSVEDEGGFVYVNLKDLSGINFYTTEDVEFSNLPAFVSPALSKLTVSSTPIFSEDEKKQRLIIFILSMAFLVIAGFVAYVIIYQWYKKKYEHYLFKNRNDLYNIVTYVTDSKKRGLDNKEIIKNLKKAGWSSEQMRYVMRKYEGKRTGLIEVPLVRLMKKVKKDDFQHKPKNK